MMIDIFFVILLGIIAGTFTGIAPGIHINLVSVLVVALSTSLLTITSPIIIATFIIAMSITHTFVNAVPAIYLGAPEPDTALNVLPGHKLLLEGRGYEAVKLTLVGSLFGLLFIIIISPIFFFIIPTSYSSLEKAIPYILIMSTILLILKEHKSKGWALISFLLSGVLGLTTLNLYNIKEPLFPLFSGLFGASGLLISLKDKVSLPKQTFKVSKIKFIEASKAISSGAIASTLCGFLPGLGAAQAAIIASSPLKKISKKTFLILVGSIDTIVMIISFIGLYLINKARNGSVLAISKIVNEITLNNLFLFISVSLIVAGLATIISLILARMFSKIINKINYSKTCIAIILVITILVFLISGPLGLLILIVATFTGTIPPLVGIGRNHLMGSLILPILLYYLF